MKRKRGRPYIPPLQRKYLAAEMEVRRNPHFWAFYKWAEKTSVMTCSFRHWLPYWEAFLAGVEAEQERVRMLDNIKRKEEEWRRRNSTTNS